ncbi:hypothetical protein [Candidatus Electrothrix sp.]|uniref:hypothetical protein n=1 Tax=Candidatus Electrothrix sp. TaxID=2170559 RepID=UPI00405734A2
MATYKNSYSKQEDSLLWEIHEIRHRLHKSRKQKPLQEINREAIEKFHAWKKERKITHH